VTNKHVFKLIKVLKQQLPYCVIMESVKEEVQTQEVESKPVVEESSTVSTQEEAAVAADVRADLEEEKKEAEKPNEMNVLDVPVTNENVALNILVTFVNLAQKRGAFNLKESSKIWECIQQFQRASGAPVPPIPSPDTNA
jgi:hypothetical protein